MAMAYGNSYGNSSVGSAQSVETLADVLRQALDYLHEANGRSAGLIAPGPATAPEESAPQGLSTLAFALRTEAQTAARNITELASRMGGVL